MKKKTISVFLILMMLFSVITPGLKSEVSAASAVKLNKTKATVYVGNATKLKIVGTTAKVKWSSSKPKVASVNSNGKVTGKTTGKATITATVSGSKYKCKVTVKKPYLNYSKLTIKVGKTKTLKLYGTKIKSVSSSNKKVATVKKTGKITAKKPGKTTITVKGTNGKTYKCKVTVKAYLSKSKLILVKGQTQKLTLYGTKIKKVKTSKKKIATISKKGVVKAKKVGSCNVTVTGTNNVKYKCTVKVENPYLNKKTLNLDTGKNYQLQLKGNTQKVTWTSSNKNVASVYKGKVKAKNPGSATITAKVASGKTYKCNVTVKSDKPSYVVSFNSNGGSLVESQVVIKGGTVTKPEDPTKEGYIFSGWYTDEILNDEFSFDYQIASDISLYAKWVAIEEETSYTRGEWIEKLASMVNMNLNIDEESLDCFYCDTQDSPNVIAIETAQAYGILPEVDLDDPEQDVPAFYPNDIATREFVAYTIVKALGYEGGYNLDVSNWKDWNSITYQAEAAQAVQEGFIGLEDNFFNPSAPITSNEVAEIEVSIKNILESTEVNYIEEKSITVYNENIIKEEIETLTNYVVTEQNNDTYKVTISDYTQNRLISEGDVIYLPANDIYISEIALKVDSVVSDKNNSLTFIGTVPEIYEVYEKIDFAGTATPIIEGATAAEGVELEYVAPMSRLGGTHSVPGTFEYKLNEFEVGDLSVEGKVAIKIPDITVIINSDFDKTEGIDLKELTLSISEEVSISGELSSDYTDDFFTNSNSGEFKGGRIELGRIPFAIGTTGLSVDLVVYSNISVNGNVSVTYNIESTQGCQYKNNTFRKVFDFDDNLEVLKIQGSASEGFGLSAQFCATKYLNLVGYFAEGGLSFDASFTPNVSDAGTVYCSDVTLYPYFKHGIDKETLIGEILNDALGFTLEFQPLDNDSDNAYKVKFHIENGKTTPECFLGKGEISGVVQSLESSELLPDSRIQVFSNGVLVKTAYTSDDGKYFVDKLPEGQYIIAISATGYMYNAIDVTVKSGTTTYVDTALMVDRNYTGKEGLISGYIIDAVTGNEIDEVNYKVYKGWNKSVGEVFTSGSFKESFYYLSLDSGNYTLVVCKDGYVENSVNISLDSNACSLGNIVMSPANLELPNEGDNLRVVLSWGEKPKDLDLHMFGPSALDPERRYHIYWWDPFYYGEYYDEENDEILENETILGNLDIDDVESYGPETITLQNILVNGMYSFYVHDFSNCSEYYSTELSKSNAKIQVYSENILVYTFNVPVNEEGTVWHVFDYDKANNAIVPVNEFYYSSDEDEIEMYSLEPETSVSSDLEAISNVINKE